MDPGVWVGWKSKGLGCRANGGVGGGLHACVRFKTGPQFSDTRPTAVWNRPVPCASGQG